MSVHRALSSILMTSVFAGAATVFSACALAQAPLAGIDAEAQAGTYCASCFPRPYRLRLTLTWDASVDLDLWVVAPKQKRNQLKGGVIYYEPPRGVPDMAWLDLDDGPQRRQAKSYREDFFIGHSLVPAAESAPTTWCVQVDAFRLFAAKQTDPLPARIVVSPAIGPELECAATVAFRSRDKETKPSIALAACDDTAEPPQGLGPLLRLSQDARGSIAITSRSGWTCAQR